MNRSRPAATCFAAAAAAAYDARWSAPAGAAWSTSAGAVSCHTEPCPPPAAACATR